LDSPSKTKKNLNYWVGRAN